jgi:hypothetical protein
MPRRFERGPQYNDTYWEGESGDIEKSGVPSDESEHSKPIPRQGLMFDPETGTGRFDDPLVSINQRVKSFSRGLGMSDRTTNFLSEEEKDDQKSRELSSILNHVGDHGNPPSNDTDIHNAAQDDLLLSAVESNLSVHDVDPPKPSRIEEAAGVVNHRPTVLGVTTYPNNIGGYFSYNGDSRVGGPRISINVLQGPHNKQNALIHELGHSAHLTGPDGKVKEPLEDPEGYASADHQYKRNKGSDPVFEGVADGYADYHSPDYPSIGDMDPKLESRQEHLRSSIGSIGDGTYGTHSKVFANPTARALYGVMRQHVSTGGEMPSSDYRDETMRSISEPVSTWGGNRQQRTDSAPDELSLGRMVHENPHLKDMYSWHPADKALHRAVNRAHLSYTGKLREETHRSKVRAIQGKSADADVSMATRVHDQLFDPDTI